VICTDICLYKYFDKGFGMKNKQVFGGLISVTLLIFGLILTGCPTGNGNAPVSKKLAITGLSFSNDVTHIEVILCETNDLSSGTWVAGGSVACADNVTIQLKNVTKQGSNYNITNSNWTGTGEYFIFAGTFIQEMLTNLQPLFFSNLRTENKVNFSDETTTIAWSSLE